MASPVVAAVAALPYSGSTGVAVGVSYGAEFSMVDRYHRCTTVAGVAGGERGRAELPVVSSFLSAINMWVGSVSWGDVVTGSGPGECRDGSVSFFVRVSSDGVTWSPWVEATAEIGDPPASRHPTPTFGDPSLMPIPYNATTPVSVTVESTQEFTSWEGKYVCWEADGDRHVSVTWDDWPSNPTESGLGETGEWSVVTGGDEDQCFSRPRASQVWLYVRVKSASTVWSDWAVEKVSIVLSPTAPTLSNQSHDSANHVEFGRTVRVSASVGHSQGFTRVQQYVSCNNREGGMVDQRDTDDGRSPVVTRRTSWTRFWDVTSGDASDECRHGVASVALKVRVLTSSGWSRWATASIPVASPVCEVDIAADTDVDRLDKWFVDCADLHRDGGDFRARRYRITLPNSTDYYPAAINVTSSTDFKITVVGGSTSVPVDSEEGTDRGGGGPVRYSSGMVKALGVAYTTYTIEISTASTSATGAFRIDMEWFELEPPTNLKANGDSSSLTSGGQALVEWTAAPIDTGYIIQYQPYCEVSSCPDWNEVTVPRGRTRHTIANLTLSQLYTIQMKTAVGGVRTPDWTDSVYVYPTTSSLLTLPGLGSNVGPVRIWVRPTYSNYRYVICVDTLPADDPTTTTNERASVIAGLNRGLEAWDTSTHRVVRATQVTSNSTACGTSYDTRSTSTIEFVDDDDMRRRCPLPNNTIATGCADFEPRSDIDRRYGVMSHVKISLDDSLIHSSNLPPNSTRSCIYYEGINLHEGGHAFGLGDSLPDSNAVTDTVMDYDLDFPCSPTENDVAAVKAVHQSVGG